MFCHVTDSGCKQLPTTFLFSTDVFMLSEYARVCLYVRMYMFVCLFVSCMYDYMYIWLDFPKGAR